MCGSSFSALRVGVGVTSPPGWGRDKEKPFRGGDLATCQQPPAPSSDPVAMCWCCGNNRADDAEEASSGCSCCGVCRVCTCLRWKVFSTVPGAIKTTESVTLNVSSRHGKRVYLCVS